jgi:hypothetical protein
VIYLVSFSSSVLDEIVPRGVGSQAHPMLDPVVFKEACDRINGFCDRNGIPRPQSILPHGKDVIVSFPNHTQCNVFRNVSDIGNEWSVSIYP